MLLSRGPDEFRDLLDLLPDLVCRLSPDGTLRYVNQSYADFHGAEPADLAGWRLPDLSTAEFRAAAERDLLALHALTPQDSVTRQEQRRMDASGVERWQQWTIKAVFDQHNRIREFLFVGRDVSAQRAISEKIRYLADHDTLTGLVNRRELLRVLEEYLVQARNQQVPLGVLYLDLDNFKSINDRLGHVAGDLLLAEVGRRLRAALRGRDIVGRVGGDEFVALCPDVQNDADMGRIVDRLRTHLAPEVELEGVDHSGVVLAVSAGWTLAEGEVDADEVLHTADQAMYQDKRQRREQANLRALTATWRPPPSEPSD